MGSSLTSFCTSKSVSFGQLDIKLLVNQDIAD